MTLKSLSVALVLALTANSGFAAAAIKGKLLILSPSTNKELHSVRVGKTVKVKLTLTNFDSIANKNVTVTYALSVMPKGSNTPISFSGKFSSKITIDGSAKKTTKALAEAKGTQSFIENLTVPEFIPAGKATLTIAVTGKGVGSVNFSEILNIKL